MSLLKWLENGAQISIFIAAVIKITLENVDISLLTVNPVKSEIVELVWRSNELPVKTTCHVI
jgi:hypothetical protein